MTPSLNGTMGRLGDKSNKAFNNKLNARSNKRWRYWNRVEDKWFDKLYHHVVRHNK